MLVVNENLIHVLSIVAGVLILIRPQILSYIVGIYLILIGVIGFAV